MSALRIRAVGMVTSLGFNAQASLAALRCGLSQVCARHLWDREAGEALKVSRVELPQWWEGAEKLPELVAPAIGECLDALDQVHPADIPILLCASSRDVQSDSALDAEHLLSEIGRRLGFVPHPRSMVIPRDQVGLVYALAHVRRIVSDGFATNCIVAGVDSLLSQSIVDRYVEARRLHTATNSNGFIPGEAGAAIAVGVGADGGRSAQTKICGLGLAHESAGIETEKPLRAEGMTRAVQHALSNAGMSFDDIAYRICDANGEHYKFKEATLLVGRLMRRRREQRFELWHPIDCLGEIGAAIGPVALAWAWHAAREAYAPGSTVLCHFGNDDGERGAVVLRQDPRKET